MSTLAFVSKAAEKVPLRYRQGPWHPVAFAFVATFAFALFFYFDDAMQTYQPSSLVHANESIDYLHLFDWSTEAPIGQLVTFISHQTNGAIDLSAALAWLRDACVDVTIQQFRLYVGGYMVLVSLYLMHIGGWVAMVSYTLLSWNIIIIRFFAAYVADGWIDAPDWVRFLADSMRFPALVGTTITCVVWWMVLVPFLHVSLDSHQHRKHFWNFNASFALINVHLLNLPIVAIEFLAVGESLRMFDLWIALAIVFAYTVFYLLALDANGIHLYICFTPRTSLCGLVYSTVMAFYVGAFMFWNYGVSSCTQS